MPAKPSRPNESGVVLVDAGKPADHGGGLTTWHKPEGAAEGKNILCRYCPGSPVLLRPQDAEEHMLLAHGNLLFTCSGCDRDETAKENSNPWYANISMFESFSHALDHAKVMHHADDDDQAKRFIRLPPAAAMTKHVCLLCGEYYIGWGEEKMRTHFQQHHALRMSSQQIVRFCRVCSANNFATDQQLFAHIEGQHGHNEAASQVPAKASQGPAKAKKKSSDNNQEDDEKSTKKKKKKAEKAKKKTRDIRSLENLTAMKADAGEVYECIPCGRPFADDARSLLDARGHFSSEDHRQVVARTWRCPICLRHLFRHERHAIREHLARKHEAEAFFCKVKGCEERPCYASASHLKEHVRAEHGIEESPKFLSAEGLISTPKVLSIFKCKLCPFEVGFCLVVRARIRASFHLSLFSTFPLAEARFDVI